MGKLMDYEIWISHKHSLINFDSGITGTYLDDSVIGVDVGVQLGSPDGLYSEAEPALESRWKAFADKVELDTFAYCKLSVH
jgi:hypothetical protein